jgi:1-acyl-sn-glycerol-3-phosphate acyltransferase
MLRTVWAAVVAIAATIPIASAVIIVALFSSASPLVDWLIHRWAEILVWGAGIDLRTDGMEKVDGGQRYVFVGNHYSYFDIPCILAAVPQPIRFMAKASLFKIPIFGWSLARAGFIPIDRKNRRSAVKSFDLAVERIRKGNSIVIFPEEGRTHERVMRPFQRGAFLLAIKSQLPMVPLAVDGTYDVFRVGARRITPGVVTIRVGEAIDTSESSVRDKEKLATAARDQIETMLGLAGVT